MLSDERIAKVLMAATDPERGEHWGADSLNRRWLESIGIPCARAIEAASTQDVRAVLVQAVEALEAADERLDATGYCSLLELSCHDKVTAAISSLRSAIQGAGSGDSSTLVGETVPGDLEQIAAALDIEDVALPAILAEIERRTNLEDTCVALARNVLAAPEDGQ